MNSPKQIIQARIDELEQEMTEVIKDIMELRNRAGGQSMKTTSLHFQELSLKKDRVLGLRSAIAELKNIKELV